MGSVKDKVAVVTGAGRGIGRAVALKLADAGAQVVLVARTRPELEELAAEIEGRGGRAAVIAADVSDPADVRRIVEETHAAFGPVDVLVNNAALGGPLGPILKIDPDEWVQTQHVNLIGPVRLTLAVLPDMIDRGWGRIVNMSSGAAKAVTGVAGQNAYGTSKGALETFTFKLGAELEGTGVTVNALRPGASDTPMQTWMREQDPDEVGEELTSVFQMMHREGLLKDADLPAEHTVALIESDENCAVIEMVRMKEGDQIVDKVTTLRTIG